MNTILKNYYKKKWGKCCIPLNTLQGFEHTVKDSRKYCEWKFENNTICLSTVIEFDGQRPAYGIYYGIRMKIGESFPCEIFQILKADYFNNYWRNRNSGCSIDDMEKSIFTR